MEGVRGGRRYHRRRPSSSGRKNESGLVTKIYGRERMVFSRQEIHDDVLKSLPKLHAALRSDPPTTDRLWRRTSSDTAKVSTFELVGVAPTADQDGTEVQYAIAGSTQVHCHLNEVLSVLTSPNSSDYEGTMETLYGKRFDGGEVLYHERCHLTPNADEHEGNFSIGGDVLLDVKMASLRPSLLSLVPKSVCQPDPRSVQRFCFQSLTHHYPGADRAVHVVKTLPRRIHDQIVPRDCCSSLCCDVDHLGVAFDIESMSEDEDTGQPETTRIFVHAYAATPLSDGFDQRRLNRTAMPRVNSEVKHVLQLLVSQLTGFERIIKRRRLGLQSFIYFPPSISKEANEQPTRCVCVSCLKRFTLFRREFYCQVCGHVVCGDCSQFYEVEPRAGEIRKNRVCRHCVNSVDACTFASEDVAAALGPNVVPVRRSSGWSQIFDDDELDSEDEDDGCAGIVAEFHSGGRIDRFEELAQLGEMMARAKQRLRARAPPAPRPRVQFSLPSNPTSIVPRSGGSALEMTKVRVQRQLERYLNRSLVDAQEKYSLHSLETASLTRNYRYAFDAGKTKYEGHPLPPIPTAARESLRLQHLRASGILEPEYDHSALDLIAQVAAKRLDCPIGFISLVDESVFHSVGTFPPRNFGLQAPRVESMCAHTVYVDKPLVIKNAQSDLRFARMLVVRDHGVRFYAGFPIRAPDGSIVATLCASDRVPHTNISDADYATMQTLATVAAQMIAPSNRVLSIPQQPRMQSDAISRVQQRVHSHDNPSRKKPLKLQNSKITMIQWK